MILKVCDRCGSEIVPKNNNPSAIKFGWTISEGNGGFTNKIGVEPFDICDCCMVELVDFLHCEPKRIGMKFKSENNEIVDCISKKLKTEELKGEKK